MKHIYGIIDQELEIAQGEVYGVSAAGMTAVVREAEVLDYKNLPQETLFQHLMAHQQVVEGLMEAETYSMLPIQFGSLLHHDGQVRNMLVSGRGQFLEMFAQFQGLIRMELIIEGEGTESYDELGQAAQLEVAKRQDALETLVRQEVVAFAQEIVKNPQMDEDVAVSVGILLEEQGQGAFDAALERIEAQANGRYTVRAVGPLAPYSFARISLRAPKVELIEHARELLGLGMEATPQEMKAAFRGHDYYMRPDRHSDLDSIIKMTELAQAYKMLKELAAGQGEAVCRMDTAAVADSVLITVKRPGRGW